MPCICERSRFFLSLGGSPKQDKMCPFPRGASRTFRPRRAGRNSKAHAIPQTPPKTNISQTGTRSTRRAGFLTPQPHSCAHQTGESNTFPAWERPNSRYVICIKAEGCVQSRQGTGAALSSGRGWPKYICGRRDQLEAVESRPAAVPISMSIPAALSRSRARQSFCAFWYLWEISGKQRDSLRLRSSPLDQVQYCFILKKIIDKQ